MIDAARSDVRKAIRSATSSGLAGRPQALSQADGRFRFDSAPEITARRRRLGRHLPRIHQPIEHGFEDFAVSHEVDDSLPPILELLRSVDPTFSPVPHRSGQATSSSFRNKDGYKVEFLTSNRGSDDYMDQPARMPALGGASADPLRFLDFLIRDPIRTVLLHKSGIPVTVPDPSRYAVHKLIVASCRHNDGMSAVKRDKDVKQAAILFEALLQTRRSSDLVLVYIEAWERGDAWKEGIRTGAAMLTDESKDRLADCLRTGSKEIGEEAVLPF